MRRAALALAILAAPVPALAETPGELEAYQLARSLQLVQDRIADGDHAAMPMQRHLLEILDGRLAASDGHVLSQRRNFTALLVYGMSGGNPATFIAATGRLDLQETDRHLADGVAAFLAGNPGDAHRELGSVDHMLFEGELGALIALVKGSVTPAGEHAAAIALFDRARLLAPGTLVEEAALRRTLPMIVAAADRERFLSLSSAYVRRFLRSPYASQYAQALTDGIATLFEGLDAEALADIMSWMNDEQAHAIYLRLARRAAIDGNEALLAFATREADLIAAGPDPRGTLYSGIASVTSETVDDVLGALVELDRSRLSAADKALLDAAKSVADAVVSKPTLAGTGAAESAVEDEPDAYVSSARARLEAIDRLLEANE